MNLEDKIEKHFRLNEKQKDGLGRIGIETIKDLLFYFPSRYTDLSKTKAIKDLIPGEVATIYGEVSKLKTKKGWKSKIPMAEGELTDQTGKIKVIWYNQAYIAKMIPEGSTVSMTGKITEGKYGKYLSNPEYELTPGMPIDIGDSLFKDGESTSFSFPIYRETKNVTSKWIYHGIQKIIKTGILEQVEDYIPEEILKKYKLPKIKDSLIWIHMPRSNKASESARKRFAFDEVFFIQLARQIDREENQKEKAYKIDYEKSENERFISKFPFDLTKAQQKAIKDIFSDFQKDYPMSRLLEGDVGSGKTAVAAVSSFGAINTRPPGQDFGTLQVAYMAPTEILANQHYENFIQYFIGSGIQIGLITGSTCKKFPSKINPEESTNISKKQLLKWVQNGEIPIVIGTHALIQKNVKFKHLALAIVDEQHRFGTKQRKSLATKDEFAPHFLSMTATPIPRTLALTIYGDLDLTLLDQMPTGRKPVITEIVSKAKRPETYDFIKEKLQEGRQLYVICPRIDEPDPEKKTALQTKSVKAEAKRLKKEVFQDYEIDILHSKMSKDKKESAMKKFEEGKTDILVATSVVEVGVNVPNATMIIIEGAERFGLAQLHQLRGRVIRSNHQAYCFVYSDSSNAKSMERLRALKTAKNGFELSELDLSLRGAGDLLGIKQWGLSDLGMEAIKNIKMVEAARNEATEIVKNGGAERFPKLKQELDRRNLKIHFE